MEDNNSKWKRIWDDELAEFETHIYEFHAPLGNYRLDLDNRDKDYVDVITKTDKSRWPIDTKFSDGKHFKICGMADEITGVIDDYYWFELILDKYPTITYWGDKIIFRTDFCTERFP